MVSFAKNSGVKPFLSVLNSTSATLAGDATYTGTGEQNGAPSVGVMVKADVAGTLYFDFSGDGTNWDSTFPVNGFTVAAATPEFHVAVKLGRYFRVRYVNGSSAQAYMRLFTYYGDFGPPNAPMQQAMGADADALIIRNANDYLLDLARSFVGGKTGIHKFGGNADVANGTTELVSSAGIGAFPTAATTVRIKAGGNAADTSDGAGARKVMVVGLDSNWADAQEELVTAGASASAATTTSFIRVFRAYVTDVGTYASASAGANTAAVIIENSAGGTDLIQIDAGEGQTKAAFYTVPAGKTAYLPVFSADVDGAKPMDIKLFQRRDADDVTAAFTGRRLVTSFNQLIGEATKNFYAYQSFPAKTDLFVTATNSGGSAAACSASFDLVLVTN